MTEEYLIKEKHLENQAGSIPLKWFRPLENILKTHICKIYPNDGSRGTGFFCNIPNSGKNTLKVLMTNNHVLKEEDIVPGKTIYFTLNNDTKDYKLLIDKSRKIYTNKTFDITIIEIKKDDKIDDNSFFDIDRKIFTENAYIFFQKKQVFLMHYPNGKEMEVSPGTIRNIDAENTKIDHLCDTSTGSSGSPIINRDNFLIIGIHHSRGSKNNNVGTLLKNPIEEFNEIFKLGKISIFENENVDINKFIENINILDDDEKKKLINNNNDVKDVISNIYTINNKIDDRTMDKNIIERYLIQIRMEAKIEDKYKFISGMGVLCNIPTKKMKALITYNDVINLEILNNTEKLIYYDYKNEKKEINMKNNRYKYTIKDLNITIIEIFNEEEQKENFIEIEDYINSKDYLDEKIYLVEYNKRKILYFDDKIIKKNNDYFICNKNNSTEGIIILKENTKLLGIINSNEINNDKIYIPMNIIINKINYIKGIYEIKKEDIGEEIQIINNMSIFSKEKNEEIEKKVKVIINGEIKLNILKYRFKEEGLYSIYILLEDTLTNMSFFFCECPKLKELDLSLLNTNKANNMSYMFSGCSALKGLDLSLFNTSKVISMESMFSGCNGIKELNLLTFNTNEVTNMKGMFGGCTGIKELNLSSFNTKKVNDMSFMFGGCHELEELYLSSFNTSQVTSMQYMFNNCTELEHLNLSSFNTSQVTDMNNMFSYCTKLEHLNLSSFNTSQVTRMDEMFCDCSKLEHLNLSSFDTNKVESIEYMFSGCSGLKELNISKFKINGSYLWDIPRNCKIKCKDNLLKEHFIKFDY